MEKKLQKAAIALCFAALLSGCEQEPETKPGADSSIAADYTSRAESYVKQGQYKVAIIELKNAVKADPSYIESHLLFAQILHEQGNHKASIAALEKIEATDPRIPLLLAKNNIQLGKAKSTLDIIAEARKSGLLDGSAEASILAAKAYIVLNNTKSAEKEIDAALNATNDKKLLAQAETVRAILYRQLNDMEKQEIALQKATKLDPKNIEAMVVYAGLKHKQEKYEEAEDILSQALYTLPTTDVITLRRLQILRAMASILSEQGRTSEALVYSKLIAESNPNAQKIETDYEAALEAIKAGDIEKAEALLQDLYQNYNMRASGALLGLLKADQGDYTSASTLFKDSIDPEVASESALAIFAGTELKLRNAESALKAIESNIKENTKNTKLLSVYGIALLANGEEEKALQVIKSTLEIDPDLVNLRLALVNLYNKKGEPEKALEQLQIADKSTATNSIIEEKLLMQYGMMKRQKEYEQYIETLASRNTVESRVLASLAMIRGNPSRANKIIDAAYNQEPTNKKVLGAKVISLLSQQKYKDAFNFAEKLLSLDANDTFALTSAALALSKSDGKQEAIRFLENQSKSAVGNWAADYVLADHYYSTREFSKSAAHIDDALSKSSFNQETTNKAIEIYSAMAGNESKNGNFAKAKKLALEAVQLAPARTDLLNQLVVIDLASGNITQAKEVADKLAQENPNSYYSLLAQGDINKAEKNIETALKYYQQAWKIRPSDKLGRAIWALTDSKAKPQFLDHWIATLPNSFEPLTLKAITYQQSGMESEALKHYEKSLSMNQRQPLALNNLAWLYFTQSKTDKAIATAEQAYAYSPENPAILDTLGWILFKQGDKKRAKELIEKAAKLAPNNEDIKEHLQIVNG